MQGSTHVSTDEYRQLLSRLVQDEDFRAEMAANPLAALAEHGVHLDPQDLPAFVKLPAGESLHFLLDAEDGASDASQIRTEWFGLLG